MKPSFKVGDTIVCVNNKSGYENTFTVGRLYKTDSVYKDFGKYFCDIQDEYGNEIAQGVSVGRFVKNQQTKNMKLKCINAKDSNSLIEGGTYTKVDTNEHGNISVMNHEGRVLTHYYKPNRFVEVSEKVVPSKFDTSKQYQTRDGHAVKIIAISEDTTYPVLGVFQDNEGWNNGTWTSNGRYVSDNSDDGLDLVEIRPRQFFMPEHEGFALHDVEINLESETVGFDSYSYSFEQLRKIVNEIDK